MRPLALVLVLALGALPAQAQTMRGFDYARPLRGESKLKAVIEFAAGKLLLEPGPADRLYQLTLQYDSERFRPVGSYDPAAGVVKLGVESSGSGGIRVGSRNALAQTAAVELSRSVDLSLDVSLGAAESALELGALRLSELDLKSGASRTTVSFSQRNPGSCRDASVQSGAGEVTVLGMGNSGCERWRFDGGVGSVNLDLEGAWPSESRLELNMAVGGVTLSAPSDLGLRVTMRGFLASFDAKGFSKSGKTYTSANYASARRRLDVEVSSALGGVSVVWK